VSAAPDDVPASLVGAVAVSLAEAVEEVTGAPAQVKWPNDVWVGGKKVAGVLAEASAGGAPGPALRVVVGVGVNVRGVPSDLPEDVAAAPTALDLHAKTPVSREDLLAAFLTRFDRALAALRSAEGRADLEARFRARAALVGRRIRYLVGATEEDGTLRDVSLARGLLVEGPDGTRAWRPMAQVSDVRAL
jgi:BirA family biotin operon repressor/biotin-[acetyl-CoA-carboxylase] ligase